MNSKPIDGAGELRGRRFNGCAISWKQTVRAFPTTENFETEGDAIESGLRRTIEGRDAVVRGLIQAGYRFRDAALVDERKGDFGSALQNLYRELERAEKLVGPASSAGAKRPTSYG